MTRLLFHYWTADDSPEARQAQIEDWIEDLIEFGPRIVADACQEWRRGHDRRPTPSDIRGLCKETRPISNLPALPAPADEAEAKRLADEWAIRRGWMNIEHFQRESFVGASIKMRRGWLTFPGLRQIGTWPEKRERKL